MRTRLFSIIKFGALVILLTCFLFSCKDAFDIQPENVLSEEQEYNDVNDADAVILGIYGKLVNISKQYVILNGLRGDLMDVTQNSDKYLRAINRHEVTSEANPYTNPRPFYQIILDCNDALHNFKVMLRENKLTSQEYNIRYSAVGSIRSWLYLELGIQFGTIPYVTNPLKNIDALEDINNYPRLSFDILLDSLVQFTEGLPYKKAWPDDLSLITSVDGYSTSKFFIPIKCLLGDLYLWRGDYEKAAENYHYMMNDADIQYPAKNSEQYYETYKIAYTGDINDANWFNIFSEPYGERYSNYEIIWDLPFDKDFNPKNPFISLFSYSENSAGGYLLRPSKLAIHNWKNQTRDDNTPGDYRGENASWKRVGNHPQINKYISNFDPLSPFETNGKWILYRAAELHLRYAEAANRDDRTQLAYALQNWGLRYTFDPEHLGTSHDSRDVTNIEQSKGYPYDFDARMGDYPHYRSSWYRNTGIRGRVSLPLVKIDSARYFDMSSTPRQFLNASKKDSLVVFMENKLMETNAKELAFEGHRWPDLLRIALRREKENAGSGVKFLQEKVGAKFEERGEPGLAATIKSRLADPKNWYLPFNWK